MGLRGVGKGALALLVASWAFFAVSGFDYSRHSIPLDEISDGGPGKDGIPSIDNPHFLSVEEADESLMRNSDRVLGFVHNGQARAYPIKILNWHEIVNDRVGGEAGCGQFLPFMWNGNGVRCECEKP